MSLNWLFAALLMLVYSEGFSAEMKFNELINETVQAQNQLAEEIQKQVRTSGLEIQAQKEKTLAGLSTSSKIDLEGSFIQFYY